MAEIRPFRGLRYNPALAGDLSRVLSPPYDVIDADGQLAYHQRSKYNVIRLEYGLELPGDDLTNNRYVRAAATLQEWRREGVLELEEGPCLYLHDCFFYHEGQRRRRRELIAAVKLEPYGASIRRHEETTPHPILDRLRLLRACQANISPVFGLFRDARGKVRALLDRHQGEAPLLTTEDETGASHEVRAIRDPQAMAGLAQAMRRKPIYIADGHHRYQAAMAYRQEMRAQGVPAGEAPFDYILMHLVAAEEPGLVVLPYHRVVRCPSPDSLSRLMRRLEPHFRVEAAELDEGQPARSLPPLLSRLAAAERDGATLGMYGLEPHRFYLLRVGSWQALDPLLPPQRSLAWRRLMVSVLHTVILEGSLGVSVEHSPPQEPALLFTRDPLEAFTAVNRGLYHLAFFLNPTPVTQVLAVADAGDVLPPKSTYFYPKLPTGLMLRSLREPLPG